MLNSKTFTGIFENDQQKYGELKTFEDGAQTIYLGQFQNGVFEGRGLIRFIGPEDQVGDSYEGDWANGLMHGDGCYIYRKKDEEVDWEADTQ